jgi:hypothetical protein
MVCFDECPQPTATSSKAAVATLNFTRHVVFTWFLGLSAFRSLQSLLRRMQDDAGDMPKRNLSF